MSIIKRLAVGVFIPIFYLLSDSYLPFEVEVTIGVCLIMTMVWLVFVLSKFMSILNHDNRLFKKNKELLIIFLVAINLPLLLLMIKVISPMVAGLAITFSSITAILTFSLRNNSSNISNQ
tara:strand:- start:8383 stop:8742 length:360 start_codon:yes stop_codon:yes gene_type:complete